VCAKSRHCPRLLAKGLRAGARHKATNLGVAVMVVIAPHNGRAEAVGLGHNGCVRHYQPLSLKSYTIVALLCVPIDVLHSDTVGKSAAQSGSAIKGLKPFLQRRIRRNTILPGPTI